MQNSQPLQLLEDIFVKDEHAAGEYLREVSFNDLTLEYGEIEHGSFGSVRAGFWNRSATHRKPVAIKFQINSEFAEAETRLHYQLLHPKIVLLVAISHCPGYFCMILEKMEVDLFHFLKRYLYLTQEKKMDIAKQITEGIVYLHDKAHVIHCDLKIENVLLRGDEVKIADFGLSTKISAQKRSKKHSAQGTWASYAPELIGEEQLFTRKTDIYAVSILMYELLTIAKPYHDNVSIPMRLTQIKNGLRPNLIGLRSPLVPLIQECWSPNPASRPFASELLTLLLAVSVESMRDEERKTEELPTNDRSKSESQYGVENALQRKAVKPEEIEDELQFDLSM